MSNRIKINIKTEKDTFDLDLRFNMNEVTSDSVISYLEIIINTEYNNVNDDDTLNRLYYRGESCKNMYRVPSLYLQKNLALYGSETYYRLLLSELGEDDYEENATLFRLISKFQHHGAKTRILDISTNPLVAFFFATEENDDKDGFVYIYQGNMENTKFDTGHTVAIKSALNLLPQDVINKFMKVCSNSIYNDKESSKYIDKETDYFVTHKKCNGLNNDDRASIRKLMDLLNQRARTREELKYLLRIYKDLTTSHIVIPGKTTNRIRQQQGAFIFPCYLDSSLQKENDAEEVKLFNIQKALDESISKLSLKNGEQSIVIKVPNNSTKKIRKELNKLGINRAFIYPGIESQSRAILD